MPQVIAAARLEHAAPVRVQARKLEIDQRRPAVRAHDDVLFLVQIVVAEADAVERAHEVLQQREEVVGQRLRAVQRRARDVGAQDDLTRPRDPPAQVGVRREHSVLDEPAEPAPVFGREAVFEVSERRQHPALTSREGPRQRPEARARRGDPPHDPLDAEHAARNGQALEQLDMPERVAFELGHDSHLGHRARTVRRVGQRATHSPVGGTARSLAGTARRGGGPALLSASASLARANVHTFPSAIPVQATRPPKSSSAARAGAIHARGLVRRFGAHTVLQPFDVDVEPGLVTGLLGPNGSGKSTFMRCLVGLVRADAGAVTLDGVRLLGDGTGVRERATYAPGELHLYGELKGHEQLTFLLRGRDRAAHERARNIADDLGLPLERRVRGYSHGMKRQLLFAAAMAPDVRVRILDEISEGLDPAKRSEILERIADDAAAGRAVLLSSHHLGEVDRVCARLLFLSKGQLIADEAAVDVARRSSRRLSLVWADEASATRALDVLRGPLVAEALRDGARTSWLLAEDDPRPFLARLAAASELPAPIALEHGRMSLSDLYRDLYGVEGT